jgi:alkyl sulfatase BDS1-like metallo-beta-lactamase superfamily hydrolase
VADTIYVAIGYALANSIMIIGHDGVVIVDVTESYDSAKEIFAEFRKITNKPVTDIIYTHNHADHTYGAKVNICKFIVSFTV